MPLSESVSEYTSENRNISYERKYLFKQSPGMFGGKKSGSIAVVMYVYKASLSNNRNSNAGEQ